MATRLRSAGSPSAPASGILGRLLTPILILAYGYSLLWAYKNFIATDFSYLGYSFREPTTSGLLTGYACCAALALSMPGKIRRPGDFVLWVMFVVATVPSLLIPHAIPVLQPTEAVKSTLVIAFSWGVAVAIGTRSTSHFVPRILVSKSLVWSGVAVISMTMYVVMFATTGLRVEFLQLDAVLDTRLQYREVLAGTSPLVAYGILLQGNVINPLLIATGVVRRNIPVALTGAFGQLLIYSVTGYKTMILSTISVFAVVMFTRRGRLISGQLLALIVAAICAFSAALDQFFTEGLVTQVFVNRMLATPGVLTAAHLWVFNDIGFVYWSNSILEPFVDYPFSRPPSFMVGYLFSGSEITSANANIFADGYMNLGYPGIVLESFLLGLLVFAVNSASRHAHLGWACGLLVVPSFALSNTGVLTAMLTHGFAAIIVLFATLGDTGRASLGSDIGADASD